MRACVSMIIIVNIAVLSAVGVHAGDRPASRRAMSFLQLGAGPRAYAMGEAFTGLADDVSALSWNPAGLAQVPDPEILFMHNQWIANLRQEYLAGTYPVFQGCTAMELSFLNSDVQLRRDADGLLDGDGFNPYSLHGGLAYARPFKYGISAGASLNYAREQLDDVTYQTCFVDCGGLFQWPGQWWSVGVAVQNLGLPVAGFSLPLTLRAGAAARLFHDTLNLTLDAARTMPGWFRYGCGAEYWYRNLFALRAGYLYRPEHEGLGSLSGVRVGLGFNIQGYQLDYALIPQGDLGYGHRASFTYFFGGGRALASEKKALIEKARKQGLQALADKDYAKAIDHYQKVLTFEPADAGAKHALALAKAGLRKQEQDQELEARFTRAQAYERQKELPDAMEEYKRILLIDDGNVKAAKSLQRLQAKFNAKAIEEHLKAGRQAFKKMQWADSLLAWQAVLAIDPEHKEAKALLKKTRAEMTKGGNTFKDPRIQQWYLEGLAAFEKRDYYQALAQWKKVLKRVPKHKQAAQWSAEARRLLEEKVASLLAAGKRYLAQGDLVKTAACWRRVLALSPKHPKAQDLLDGQQEKFQQHAKTLYLKGIEEYTQGLYKQAIANWKDVLVLAPAYNGAIDKIEQAQAKLKAIQK